ncbi:MAG TPA: MFS transporter [Desulfobacterales bacterium]|nr:MFS transporter [Desulfobacterales bacterium]
MNAFKDYLHLLRTYPRYLIFGMLHMFYSSPGQTFAVAIFVPSLTAAFGLSAGGFGLLYSTATLASALVLPFLGPMVDRHNLRIYSVCVGVGMMIGCLVTATATIIPLLFTGILMLRLFGQGLMTQIAGVATTRFFGDQRGKALAIVGVGFSAGTAVFPVTLALLISIFDWQATMVIVAAFCLFLFMPISLGLLKKTDRYQQPPQTNLESGEVGGKIWTRKDVLQIPFFYFSVPMALLIPFVSTGLIIHIGSIADHKGWSLEWVAAWFAISAITGRIGSFWMGSVVDRYKARTIYPYVLIPYICGLIILASGTHAATAPIWLFFSGLGVGCTNVTMSVLWAESFGVQSLGAITSLIISASVFATALSPVLFGWLIDLGVPITAIVVGGIVLTMLVSILAFLSPDPSKKTDSQFLSTITSNN